MRLNIANKMIMKGKSPLGPVNRVIGNMMSPNTHHPLNPSHRMVCDRDSKDMVKYNYFEAVKPTGEKVYHYVGSKKAVRRVGEDIGDEYTDVKEMPFDEVNRILGPSKMDEIRKKTKNMYTSSGKKIFNE